MWPLKEPLEGNSTCPGEQAAHPEGQLPIQRYIIRKNSSCCPHADKKVQGKFIIQNVNVHRKNENKKDRKQSGKGAWRVRSVEHLPFA